MAELSSQDVVDQSQSVGDLSLSDAPAITSNTASSLTGEVDSVAEVALKENGIHSTVQATADELEDVSGRSDTDTSRADGSVAGDKASEFKPVKKFSVSKPVSFAKYSVPKVIAANAAKGTDKGMRSHHTVVTPEPQQLTSRPAVPTPSSSTSSLPLGGRPRLVAKTVSSSQQKAKAFKPAAPDPMQVWNKNRGTYTTCWAALCLIFFTATPQPSTKHLTDEELKQQYGIHLTSRLQADAEGKESKWADIDDDEDDWAPETIEWNDGTKTTLAAADLTPVAGQKQTLQLALGDQPAQIESNKIRPLQITSSVGPNATVLRLGASAERQQAQKAAVEKARSTLEKQRTVSSSAAPAPTPAKSPWAALPPVDKLSPIAINPQPMGPPTRMPSQGYVQTPAIMNAPSPATEISADDFNRAWKDAPSSQPRELFMPNSGRYEAVPESRRRMSKNDQSFRAPAVLQRPSQSDGITPAEPSAAFQTHRTSTDVSRRRASSTISGGSGQLARRMSLKSSEMAPAVFDSQPRPPSQDGPIETAEVSTQLPTYQARSEQAPAPDAVPAPFDIEAQREKQKAEMKQRIDLARKRKEEEQVREEAEKQERIRQKLASLAPIPPKETPKSEEEVIQAAQLDVSVPQANNEHARKVPEASPGLRNTPTAAVSQSPPKPPQPLATGQPQQYGMMKVHPLDTVTKHGSVGSQGPSLTKLRDQQDDASRMPPPSAPARPASDNRRPLVPETTAGPEGSPKLPKTAPAAGDARNGWGDVVDPRAQGAGNLWGMPSNKALGNGTFDQTLAGYAPQDLSRTSSTAQGWMNGKTPTAGRSPQPQHLTHHVPEPRSQLPQTLISPEATPLAADSEADSMFPTVRPAPIGPPQHGAPLPQVNGMTGSTQPNGPLAAWHNFHQVAGTRERADNKRHQRDMAATREEELRSGIRQGPQYTFNETWKQVDPGDEAGQRQLSNVYQTSIPPSSNFGAVGQPPRGSRFFPQAPGSNVQQDRRAVTYSHPEISRSPSPPPAEEYDSYHPAYDGNTRLPKVRLPMAKPVVNLPPALPPTPPSPAQPMAAPEPEQPLTWAARVSMPAAPRPPALRATSTPLVHNPSWQERFNGLLGKKPAAQKTSPRMTTPALAVTSSSREPLEVVAPVVSASVSLPQPTARDAVQDTGLISQKTVEEEEDLFEDRELASLPTINLPPLSLVSLPLQAPSRGWTRAVMPSTVDHLFLTHYPTGRQPFKLPEFALVKMFPAMKQIKIDLPQKSGTGSTSMQKQRNASSSHPMKNNRFRGGKSRQVSRAN